MWDNLVPRFQGHVERGRAAIGLLHANVGGHQGHENYAPCTLRDLASLDIGYWALGHVHTRRIDEAGSVLAAYPGNPQGRNPTEIGARGVFPIEVSDGGEFSNPVFHAVDKVRWTQVSVEVTGMDDQTELEAAIRSSLDDARSALFPSGGRSNRDAGDVCLNDRDKVHLDRLMRLFPSCE